MSTYKLYECDFNPGGGVMCECKTCSKCGWNPEVGQARLEAIIEKLKEEAKEE